ncbi:polymer-forming cytoskeletal protein [Paenibacillus ehimensis]|uniref:polymer-forming cytoskeletal protein n=1 Tax=Paenibacillus ehimensis TaxID=79264 RepID=UPI002DBB5DAB|nr:polymer-forming cytoskeletal protein [Paenibacillus ehimensis]MEC0209916.1 polymer-forming cytoskeletal protein [Paenibacillus ehimensis]
MDSSNRRDLIISGSGSSSGGSYRNVKINGEGKIYGDIDCFEFRTNGVSEVSGQVKAKLVQVNGQWSMKGTVESEEIKVYGGAKLEGNVSYLDFKCRGSARVQGDMNGDRIDLEGDLTVAGDCEAETFNAKGAFRIDGLLNAGVIDVSLYGASSAQEIGGEVITVRKKGFRSLLTPFLPMFDAKLEAETIEGDEIYLENTTAKVVRGSRITIGSGCEIDLVEYKESLNPFKGAKIHEHRQI